MSLVDPIDKLFAPDSALDPDGVAVIDTVDGRDRQTSLEDFRSRAKCIAVAIEKYTAPSERVAILLPQQTEAYSSEIACLLSGRLFCPLDPSLPSDRVLYCLRDFAPSLLITDADGAEATWELGIKTIFPDALAEAHSLVGQFGEMAYVIYTSGSTGRPKGVRVSRRSMNKFLEWAWDFYDIQPGDRWAQFSSIGFDLSLVDLLTCIPSGGTLVPVRDALDRMLPARLIERYGITVWHSVPSIIPLILKDGSATPQQLETLRIASFCGEALYPQQANALLECRDSLRLLNTYGPTEGTFFCSVQTVDASLVSRITGGSLPIGEPIPGWQFRFEPHNETSLEELVIVSDYISDGYMSETKDAERYFVDQNGMPAYRTGDLIRRNRHGVFFVQRFDNQVKISGNRIDLSEIEFHALEAGAAEAKAFLYDDRVYLAVAPGPSTRSHIVSLLEANVPRPALPADIVELPTLPRNDNGKIDVSAIKVRLMN